MAWWKERARRANSQEFIGVPIAFLGEEPPTPIRTGLYRVKIMDLRDSKMYQIVMIESAIDDACVLQSQYNKWTFDDSKPYPKPAEWVERAKK